MNYYVIQMFTGHSNFGAYLYRFDARPRLKAAEQPIRTGIGGLAPEDLLLHILSTAAH